MRYFNRPAALLLLAFALAFYGYRASHASPSPSHPSSAAASRANPFAAPSSAQSPRHSVRRPARDSELAVYYNPGYSISFRYPRNYLLQEPEPDQNEPDADAGSGDSPFPLPQQEPDTAQPDARLVATVLIPDDAYPNTTFARGHLQFLVNPRATTESCLAVVASPASAPHGASGTVTVQGVPFDWQLRRSADAESRFVSADYAGFSNGSCYVFRIEIVDTGSADPDAGIKPADISKILRPLEKIVLSFQIHPAG